MLNKNRSAGSGLHRFGPGGRGHNRGGAFGPGGYCVCTDCGKRIPHERDIKCTSVKCPGCGHIMVREELVKKNQGAR